MTADIPQAAPPRTSSSVAQTSGGMRGLLEIRAFRGIAVANVLSAVAYGSSRFVFVWLVGDLTDWNTATAILGVLIGLPPLFLSAWAGSLADRLDPQRFGMMLFAVSTALFAGTALLVEAGTMTVPLAMACAFVTAIAPSMLVPLLQALVPTIVPPARLMQAVAIQNLGMMASVISGTFVGGAIIQAFGVSAGFWLLAIASALGALRYGTCPLPDQLAGDRVERKRAIRDGASIALGSEPLRSLLALTSVFGIAIAASTLLLPEFARDVLDKDSLAASAINVAMSLGMVGTSMLLALRWSPRRPGLVLSIVTTGALGGGLIAIGSSESYLLVMVFAFCWGVSGGIAMTLLRTLTQVHTPPELMGRVMGLAAMAQNGAFPIGALMLVGLVAATSVGTALVLSGALCTAGCAAIAARPHIREL
jgi:MFS family permease